MEDCNGEIGGQGCGVQRKLDGGGPAKGLSLPTQEKRGETLPTSERSRMWSSMQLPPSLGTRAVSCSIGCLLPVDLGLVFYM